MAKKIKKKAVLSKKTKTAVKKTAPKKEVKKPIVKKAVPFKTGGIKLKPSHRNIFTENINKFRPATGPIIVQCTNPYSKPIEINLFGSGFNDFKNDNVTSVITGISYEFIQKDLLANEYNIGLIKLSASGKGSVKFLDNLLIYLTSKNIKGELCQRPIRTTRLKGQIQLYQREVLTVFKLNHQTEIRFILPPGITLNWYLFPFAKDERIESPEHILYKINHTFGRILAQKYIEAKNICDNYKVNKRAPAWRILPVHPKEKLTEIENNIYQIDSIPADFYRNMVNLYIALDNLIKSFQNLPTKGKYAMVA